MENHDEILSTIQPIKVRDLPAFIAGIRPIAAAFASRDVYLAFAENIEAVIIMTALGAGVTHDWLDAQTPDVLIDLATRVIEVNADFFTQSILPAMDRAGGRLNSLSAMMMMAAGTPSSTPLSSLATA